MQRREPRAAVAQHAELRDGRIVHIERREDDGGKNRGGVFRGHVREIELEHPRLAASDEDVADELRMLGLQRAGLCVPHAAARGGGDLCALAEFRAGERTRHAQAQAVAVVGVHLCEAVEHCGAGLGCDLLPRGLDGAHAEDPRQERHRGERGGSAVAAFEQAVAHEARGLVLVGG